MKLSGRDAKRFASRPNLELSGALIYGEDGVEVADREFPDAHDPFRHPGVLMLLHAPTGPYTHFVGHRRIEA